MNEELLKRIFDSKYEFESQFYDLTEMSTEKREELSCKIINMILVESVEFLRELNYKLLLTERIEIDKEKLKEELIDIGHFYFFLCILWGIDDKEFFELFMKKDEKIRERIFLGKEKK